MTAALAPLFYLAVLALVVGCIVYLYVHRRGGGKKGSPGGQCPLGDPRTILTQLAATEAWGGSVSLRFLSVGSGPQVLVEPGEVELFGVFPDPAAMDRFRRCAADLELTPAEGGADDQYSVTITGTWEEVVGRTLQLLRELYRVDESEIVDFKIFKEHR